MAWRSLLLLTAWSSTSIFLVAVSADERATTEETDPIVALVDDVPVRKSEVDREIGRVVARRDVSESDLRRLRELMVTVLIDRRLASAYLDRKGLGASDDDVALEIARLERGLQQQDLKLSAYLERTGQDEEQLRRALRWRIGWERYLKRFLTDENLRRYFDQHRRHFDGTRLRVAQILLQPQSPGNSSPGDSSPGNSSPGNSSPGNSSPREATLAEARKLRTRILAGELTFAEAAREYSRAPSRETGGDIGWISRHEPMPEAFSRAAFDLRRDEVAEPVVTPAGVHLIRCLEIESGERPWMEARKELREATTEYLFRWVVDQQRPHSQIRRLGPVSDAVSEARDGGESPAGIDGR